MSAEVARFLRDGHASWAHTSYMGLRRHVARRESMALRWAIGWQPPVSTREQRQRVGAR